MDYLEFLNEVIERGKAAARRDYIRPDQAPKLSGSIAGFEACRDRPPSALKVLLDAAREKTRHLRMADVDPENYWHQRCYELEIEWVCNVVSVALLNKGQQVIIPPTARGAATAARILGVQDV